MAFKLRSIFTAVCQLAILGGGAWAAQNFPVKSCTIPAGLIATDKKSAIRITHWHCVQVETDEPKPAELEQTGINLIPSSADCIVTKQNAAEGNPIAYIAGDGDCLLSP